MDYIILMEKDLETFQKKAIELLEKKYLPAGGVDCQCGVNGNVISYTQAFYKTA